LAIPIGVRELVRSRLACLSDTARQVVTAVAGRDVDENLVRQVAGRTDEETLAGLEELVARGLLRPSDTGLDFVNDRIRAVAHEDTNAAGRRLLHARVAEALAARARPAVRSRGSSPNTLGWAATTRTPHDGRYVRETMRVRFSPTGRRANTTNRHSPSDSATSRPSMPGSQDSRCSTAITRPRSPPTKRPPHMRTNRWPSRRSNTKLGALHLRRRSWSTARAHLEAALTAVDDQDKALAARITADLGLLELTTGDLEGAAHHAEAGDDDRAVRLLTTALTARSRAAATAVQLFSTTSPICTTEAVIRCDRWS
jgi:hypothetical protein